MSASKQSTINHMQQRIRAEQSQLRDRINILEKRFNRLNNIATDLDDPHALIPNQYKSVDDWLNGHPFPSAVLSNIYRNYSEAREVSFCCNTYQQDYHIVKCEKKEYYIKDE